MRKCNEKPSKVFVGHYCCGGGITINGERYCSEYAQRAQIEYAGHLFCADLGDEKDEKQVTFEEVLK